MAIQKTLSSVAMARSSIGGAKSTRGTSLSRSSAASLNVMDDCRCPICGKVGESSPRYPRYICVECAHRAVDENGRRLKFSNVAFSGGFEARYVDNDEIRDSHICYVDGV